MDHEQAFLQAIRAEPQADAHRLDFANWMVERGNNVSEREMTTCQRLGVEPWAYLQDVLTRLPMMAGQLDDFVPDHWQAARQAKMATLRSLNRRPFTPH